MVPTADKREAKRKARVKQSAEIFTPPKLVNEMLDKLPKEVWDGSKTFLDPAAGNGEFLIFVFLRKIQRGHTPLSALKTIYGVELLNDNVQECRVRLLKLASYFDKITIKHIEIIWTNIVCADSLKYDFEFESQPTLKQCKQILEIIQKQNIFDRVTVPDEDDIS